MAAKNDITGDSIQTRGASKQFEENFDQIDWSVKLQPEIELSDKPQVGEQRLNNLGQLESYYGGTWIVREIRSH
jgi:hypothetical protein